MPADYFEAADNGDNTYACSLKTDGTVGNYTAATAPIVMPINIPGYSAQSALTYYTDVSDYTDQGFIYVHAGCRGRDDGAPAGVTDLKAAIRYIRYNSGAIAGDTESIFTFGMSGGGAQSAIVGATGDSELYNNYLTAIGAVEGISDAVAGSMCWCPITNLDTADGELITYGSSTNKATITSVEAFVKALKTASKDLGAFDQLDGGQGENTLFGYADGSGAHFDSTLAAILKELGSDYASAYETALAKPPKNA